MIDHLSGPLNFADSTIVKKWKRLFVIICESKAGCLGLRNFSTRVSVRSGIMLKNNNTSVE